jgi:hypothetical protein
MRRRRKPFRALKCLKKYGQRLDLEIAAEIRLPLVTVRSALAELSATGAVVIVATVHHRSRSTVSQFRTCP